jgi:hypothetical protein
METKTGLKYALSKFDRAELLQYSLDELMVEMATHNASTDRKEGTFLSTVLMEKFYERLKILENK